MGLTIQDRLHHKSAYKSRNMSFRNIFSLLSFHQEFLLDNLRRWGPFNLKAQLSMAAEERTEYL